LIVVDASLVADALVVRGPDGAAARSVLQAADGLAAPSILVAEVMSALRSLERRGGISAAQAAGALDVIRRLPHRAFPIDPVLDRVWELRGTITVYDAWYVALAERLGTALHTTDRRLAAAPGIQCEVVVP
jgi:predicted nucleic acid-binding protein